MYSQCATFLHITTCYNKGPFIQLALFLTTNCLKKKVFSNTFQYFIYLVRLHACFSEHEVYVDASYQERPHLLTM